MYKIAAFTFIAVVLLISSVALNTILIPVAVRAAPQTTPPAKPNFGNGGLPSSGNSPQFAVPDTKPDITLPEGQAMVIVQLDSPPLVEIFQQAYQDTNSLSDALTTMRNEQKTLNNLRQSLIAQLTAPPFNAQIISATSLVSNTLMIDVDVSLIPLINELPGVLRARIDRIGQLDSGEQSPSQPNSPANLRPGFGPVLD